MVSSTELILLEKFDKTSEFVRLETEGIDWVSLNRLGGKFTSESLDCSICSGLRISAKSKMRKTNDATLSLRSMVGRSSFGWHNHKNAAAAKH